MNINNKNDNEMIVNFGGLLMTKVEIKTIIKIFKK